MRLIVVDTTGIQPYIFGSNRLRENIGASHLVAQATGAWALQVVREWRSNVTADGRLDDEQRIEAGEIEVEVVYSGGGNFVALFRDDEAELSREFAEKLSRRILAEAPGLQLVMASLEFRWDEPLAEALPRALQDLKVRKNSRSITPPLAGLGVTVPCQSTGLPATRISDAIGGDAGYPISAEIEAKLDQAGAAGERLMEMLPLCDGYSYPVEFDDLGRSRGEFSYIAVVHADGNGIGQRLIRLGKAHKTAGANREFINQIRQFSTAVETASQGALKGALDALIARISNGEVVHAVEARMKFKLTSIAKSGETKLPFRPIVFGGDDLTFVCDGRLGISLAIEYIRRFEELTSSLPDGSGAVTACAGIAIVKSHYPFARAYQLAEELCGLAKSYRRELGLNDACLDWHFATGGLFGGITEIRNREYKTKSGILTQRPLTLMKNPADDLRSWPVVHEGLKWFQASEWAERRNKVKALRDALRDGHETVNSFLVKYNDGNNLPNVAPRMSNIDQHGWHQNTCGYFDAIEMIDWYYAL
jgi:hypothetical protein